MLFAVKLRYIRNRRDLHLLHDIVHHVVTPELRVFFVVAKATRTQVLSAVHAERRRRRDFPSHRARATHLFDHEYRFLHFIHDLLFREHSQPVFGDLAQNVARYSDLACWTQKGSLEFLLFLVTLQQNEDAVLAEGMHAR